MEYTVVGTNPAEGTGRLWMHIPDVDHQELVLKKRISEYDRFTKLTRCQARRLMKLAQKQENDLSEKMKNQTGWAVFQFNVLPTSEWTAIAAQQELEEEEDFYYEDP